MIMYAHDHVHTVCAFNKVNGHGHRKMVLDVHGHTRTKVVHGPVRTWS